jgi:hypothetical protein
MATRKKSKSYKRNAEVSEADVEAALRVLRADYYSDVLGVAKDLAERMKDGEVDEFSDALHEAVDGTQRVIYTYRARIGLICTDNADAYTEELGEVPVKNGTVKWEAMMFMAMERDVVERLEASDVDVNDPDSWADIDMKTFD